MKSEAPEYLARLKPEDCMLNLLLEKRAKHTPNNTFISFRFTRYSYSEFNAAVNSMARRLIEEGVTQGSIVAILMQGSPEYLTLWFALSKIGAVEAPINTAYKGEMLRHQLSVCKAQVCVIDEAHLSTFQKIQPSLEVKRCFVNHAGIFPDGLDSENIFTSFQILLEARDTSNLNLNFAHSEPASIIFTSGTTGPSKGVLLSYRYVTACGVIYADINELNVHDVVLNFLPFFHVAAKNLTIGTLVGGGSMRLLPRFSISNFWQEVKTHKVTHFMGVGGICNMLLSRSDLLGEGETTLKTIYAVPDPDNSHQAIEKWLKCQVNTVYGSTEVGLPISRNFRTGYRKNSCGKLNPFYEVKIVDANDNEVPVGESGEIVVRPKQPFLVASGYIGMPEKTVETWRNLWLHSGDRGRVDADGWYFFEDRVSDSMRRRGENISSYEVESLVGKLVGISEVAAVAAPSEIGEDEVRIFVILVAGIVVSAEEIFIQCGEAMPYFMIPRYIDIVESFPRTPTEKVEKYKLRSMPIQETTWDYKKHGWALNRSGIAKE